MIGAYYGLRKSGGGHGVMDALMASVLVDFNRCLVVMYYEKSSLNTNPIVMTICS